MEPFAEPLKNFAQRHDVITITRFACSVGAALELTTRIARDDLERKKDNAAQQRNGSERGSQPIVLVHADHDQHDTEQQKKDGRSFLD
jgi:hypothetical protein